jgi:hypothetical protein
MRVAWHEVPGKIRKTGASRMRMGRLIRSLPPGLLAPEGYFGQWSHLVLDGVAAKNIGGGADGVLLSSSFSKRTT